MILDDVLRKEVIEYTFPQNEAESINTQIKRYVKANINKEVLNSNEQIITPQKSNISFICHYDKNKNIDALYHLDYETGLSLYDIQYIQDPVKQMFVVIFHHNDLDGFAAGAIANRLLDGCEGNKNKRIDFISYNYVGDNISRACDHVYQQTYFHYYKFAIVVDLNLKDKDFSQIISVFDKVLVIDHHDRSIKTIMNLTIKKRNCLFAAIDTRYSAAYLCYILFKPVVQELTGKVLQPYCPTFISMLDTHFNIAGKRPKSYFYGMDINQYLNDMSGLEPYANMWKQLLTDNDKLFETIELGDRLREIAKEKIKLTFDAELKYVASYQGKVIRAMVSPSSNKFIAAPANAQDVKIIMRYMNYNNIIVAAYSDNIYVKKANLGIILSEALNDSTGGGHPGAAGATANIRKIKQIIEYLKTGKQPNINNKPYPNIIKIFNEITFKTDPNKNHPRFDSTVFEVFKFISAVIYCKWIEVSAQ